MLQLKAYLHVHVTLQMCVCVSHNLSALCMMPLCKRHTDLLSLMFALGITNAQHTATESYGGSLLCTTSTNTFPTSVACHDLYYVACCREVQQQLTALQLAQAELAAERNQLSAQQQLIAEQRQHAVQQVQEAAQAHNKLLAQLKQARSRGLLVLCYTSLLGV